MAVYDLDINATIESSLFMCVLNYLEMFRLMTVGQLTQTYFE